jgi:hypothetical protein
MEKLLKIRRNVLEILNELYDGDFQNIDTHSCIEDSLEILQSINQIYIDSLQDETFNIENNIYICEIKDIIRNYIALVEFFKNI